MKIAIIGAGLAGTACAYVLKQAGHEPEIYEAGSELASGASGNAIGLYNPRLFAEITPQSLYHKQAFDLALETFKNIPDVDWNPCGAVHLMSDEKRKIRFYKMAQNWDWPEEKLRILAPRGASDLAGAELRQEALYLPRSGFISPKKLCAAYARGVKVHLGVQIHDLSDIEAAIIILACGPAAANFRSSAFLPLNKVRGQITWVEKTPQSVALKACLCYGGYVAPAYKGAHILGSTFQRWLDHTDVLPQDDADNLSKLEQAVPGLTNGMGAVSSRASIRTTAPDHFPIVGQLGGNVYVSTAHGSHGILSSLMAAHLLRDMIESRSAALPESTIKALSPYRFA